MNNNNKNKKKYQTGFFKKVIGKDILPKYLRDKLQFAYDNPTLGMTEEDFKKRREKKAKEKRKKAAIQMADTEYEMFDKNKQKYTKVKKAKGGLIVASMYNKDK